MRTSPRAEHQFGFTLFELLIVLAVLAAATGIVGFALQGNGSSMTVRGAADRFASDLSRVATAARATGEAMTVELATDGYTATALGIDVRLSRGVSLSSSAGTSLTFYPDGYAQPVSVVLRRGEIQKVVSIEAYTGRIRAE
ncbi:pilus assembly FimT family protein [Parvularcula oceani]|uniref:pilus assembly FimT family protein n=1 Tax=Parvularcula oceani TaxID=1247963 RepID=UPI0004E14E6F|nr:prepilin-type N-terminal cleavage/methylation domain-containing protein [Parvularcula oceani]